MVAEGKIPDPVDPLHGCSIISLLPRTRRDFNETAVSEKGDMEFLQSCLKKVTIECPDKHLKQAKAILSSTSEPQNSDFPSLMLSDDKEKPILGKDKDQPQERRPAMGRKRAQFSFKPNTSQPVLDEDVNLNIDQLQDPEDFFLAFEKLENAKKELQRQRGHISTDISTHNASMKARNRRPGILGRKTVSYKHRHSSVLVDSEEAVLSSQEKLETDIPGQSNNSLIIEMADQHAESKEEELACHGHVDGIHRKDLLTGEGKRLGNLLDEILSTNCTEIDEDGAVTFLQDRLQIKPLDLEKLYLPKLDRARSSDRKASAEQLGGPRKALSDIHNKLRRVSSKTTSECQQVAGTSMGPLCSPNPPRSPYSAIADLKRRLSQMEPPVNPFSFRGLDTSPARNCSQVEGIEMHDVSPNNDYDPNDANDTISAEDNDKNLNFAGLFQSLLHKEDNPADSNMVSKKLLTENSACPPDMPMDGDSNIKNADINIRSSGSNSDKQEVTPHFGYVHNEACHSDTTSMKLNGKRLSSSQRLQSPVLQEDNIAGSDMVSGKLMTDILASPNINVDDSLNRVNMEMASTLSGSDGDKHKVSPNADYDHNFQSPMVEEHNTTGSSMLSKDLMASASPSGMPTNDNKNKANSDIDIRSSESVDNDKDIQEEAVAPEQPELDFESMLPMENMDYGSHLGKLITENLASPPEISMIESSSRLNTDMDIGSNGSDNVEDQARQESCRLSVNERGKQEGPPHNQRKQKQVSNQKSLTGKLVIEKSSCLPEKMSMDESSKRSNTDMDIRSSGSDVVQDQAQQKSSKVSTNDSSKQEGPSHNRRKRKEISSRKSLAGAGTVFDSETGQRKSTRYRTQPLEFWKGECFVYGRTHNTMSTVIGVKRYESPASAKGKGRKRLKPARFTVESLVSHELKDLVEKAALH